MRPPAARDLFSLSSSPRSERVNDSSGRLNSGVSVWKGAPLSFALALPKPLSANLFHVQMPTPSDTLSLIPPRLLLLLEHHFIHLCPSGTEIKEIIEFSHWPISPKPGTWLFLFPLSPLCFSGSDFEPPPCTLPHFLKKSENPCQGLPLAKDLSSGQAANLFPWQKVEAIPYDIPLIDLSNSQERNSRFIWAFASKWKHNFGLYEIHLSNIGLAFYLTLSLPRTTA